MTSAVTAVSGRLGCAVLGALRARPTRGQFVAVARSPERVGVAGQDPPRHRRMGDVAAPPLDPLALVGGSFGLQQYEVDARLETAPA